jgi:hypothetical protein
MTAGLRMLEKATAMSQTICKTPCWTCRDSSTAPGKWGVYGTKAESLKFEPTFGNAALEDPEVQVLGPGVRLSGAQRAGREHPKGLHAHSALARLAQTSSATSSMLTHLKTYIAWHQRQCLVPISE